MSNNLKIPTDYYLTLQSLTLFFANIQGLLLGGGGGEKEKAAWKVSFYAHILQLLHTPA